MKLSEAINLGAVTVKMDAFDLNSCAFGGACNALGFARHGGGHNRWDDVETTWPWVRKHATPGRSFERKIFEMFDYEVVAGRKTLEELIDYVRFVEPSCGECNSFDCTCIKTSDGAEGLSKAQEEVLACSAR